MALPYENATSGDKAVRSGPRNPNWRGGRVIASNGYVLLRVGIGHHLADVRGYAYEHRVIAEQTLGRRLREGEIVHHRDGDKQNNVPENIEVVASTAHHFVLHRRTDIPRRYPDEPNEPHRCACGCGTTFNRYDTSGRPRSFVSGHNPALSPRSDAVLAALSSGPLSRLAIKGIVGGSIHATAVALSKLRRAGKVQILERGVWSLV